jgi:hypothetical protein
VTGYRASEVLGEHDQSVWPPSHAMTLVALPSLQIRASATGRVLRPTQITPVGAAPGGYLSNQVAEKVRPTP